MKFLDQFFNYFSGNAQRTRPARCTKTFINCLFGSLMRDFKTDSKSVGFPKFTLAFYSSIEDSSSAADFLFYQLLLSFNFGNNLKI